MHSFRPSPRYLARNISLVFGIRTLQFSMLAMPVIVLFFREHGLNMQDVIFLQVIFSFILAGFEVPSGMLADKYGRRLSIVLGSSFGFLGYFVYCFSHGFYAFLVAEALMAIGASLLSGADSAMLYDSLKSLRHTRNYLKIEGRLVALSTFAEGMGAFIGGALGAKSLVLPFEVQAFLYLVSVLCACFLVEPPRHQSSAQRISLVTKIQITLIQSPELKALLMYAAIIGASTFCSVWFLQPYIQSCGVSIGALGIVWALWNLSTAGFALLAHQIVPRLSLKALVFLPLAVCLLAWIGCGFVKNLLAIAIVFLFYAVRGFGSVFFRGWVQRLAPDDQRATILSLQSFIMRMTFCVFGPGLAYVCDHFGFRACFLSGAFLFCMLGLFFGCRLLKAKKAAEAAHSA